MPKMVTAWHVEREKKMIPPPNPNLQATYEETGPHKAVSYEMYEADARKACEEWPEEWFMDEKDAKKEASRHNLGAPVAEQQAKRGPGRPKKNDKDEDDEDD